jgi:hypothetical protein
MVLSPIVDTIGAMKSERAKEWKIPPEIEAVLKASTNLQPCKRNYGELPYYKFLEHIRIERCAKCYAFFLQLDNELKMMAYLRDHKD